MYIDNGINGLGKFSLKKLIQKHPLTKAVVKLPAPLKAPIAVLAPAPVRAEILKPAELIPPGIVKTPAAAVVQEPTPEPTPAPVMAPVEVTYSAPPSSYQAPTVYDTGVSPSATRFAVDDSYYMESEPSYAPAMEPVPPSASRMEPAESVTTEPEKGKANWLIPAGIIALLTMFG